MAKPTLLPDPTCLHLRLLDASSTEITAVVATTSAEAECPLCRRCSDRIHSRYLRQVADLPWMGCAVRLELHVRRFFCSNQECKRRIFTERLPTVVAPYARRTTRLTDVLTLIGFALGGEAGKRLVAGMGLAASPDTLKKWLIAHPGVEIISRDRGGAYAEGASLGAPAARQVADRFHLLVNLSETLEDFFLNKRTALKDAVHDPESLPPPLEAQRPARLWHKGVTQKQEEKSLQLHQERVERYHKVHDLHGKKADVAEIARELGMARRTVYHYLKMTEPPERMRIMNRKGAPKKVAPYQEYLLRRWNEGCRNAKKLWRELAEEQGYTASYSNVERFLAPLRTKEHKFKQEEPAAQPVKKTTTKRPPTARQVSRWFTLPQDRRLNWQNAYLERLFQADPVIARTAEHMVDFATMLRERAGERLDEWLEKVETQGVSELCSFAQGLRKDYDAVKAGLTWEWSNGQTEGQVHRLKLLKRQMYGRGSFQVLRKRVLQRA